MFELRPLSPSAIPSALAKAERYRLLNEGGQAESICLDVLAVDPNNQEALAMMILSPIAALLIQSAISRSREFAADAGGAKIAGTPYGLADALRKIEAVSKRVPLDANPATAHMFIIKPFSVHGLLGLFSSHPPTEKRIAALMGRV